MRKTSSLHVSATGDGSALTKTTMLRETPDPKKMFVVSIMPCTAKKYEIHRSKDMFASGVQNIDISLTTRELIPHDQTGRIDFVNLPDEEPDHILANIPELQQFFGVTGGVMEAHCVPLTIMLLAVTFTR